MFNPTCLSCGAVFERSLLESDEELRNGYCPVCKSDYIEIGSTKSPYIEVPVSVVER